MAFKLFDLFKRGSAQPAAGEGKSAQQVSPMTDEVKAAKDVHAWCPDRGSAALALDGLG